MPIRFLVNVMLLQFNLVLLHTRVIFSYFGYQILQGFTNCTLGKNRPFFLHIHFQIFFSNWLTTNYKILPTCNSLLIYEHEEKPNIEMKNKNNKHLLQLQLKPCYSVDLEATRSKNC
jgi:hypothetical protein